MATPAVSRIYPKGFRSDILNDTTFMDGFLKAATAAAARAAIGAGTGSGDAVGPASATDNAIARFDSTTGKLIQNSSVVVNDLGGLEQSASASGMVWQLFAPNGNVNPAAAISSTEATNADGISKNFVFLMGHNVDSSGGRFDTTKGQVMLQWESDYRGSASGTQAQEFHLTMQAPGVVRTGNRVFGTYSENNSANISYGIRLASDIDNRQYNYTDINGANAGNSWRNQTPSIEQLFDRVDNTTYIRQISATGVSYTLNPITGLSARDYTFNLNASGRFIVSQFIINPTANTIDFGGYKPGLIRSSGSIQAEGSLYAALGAPLYLSNPSDVIKFSAFVDSSNNALLRSSTTAGGDYYIGMSSGTATGSIRGQTAGANRFELKSNGQFLFTPDGSTTVLTVDANGLGFYGTAGGAKPNITGLKGGNAALASLLSALATRGLITDSSGV